MSEVWILFFFFLVSGFVVMGVSLRTLTKEVQNNTSLLVRLVDEKPKALLPAGGDSVVHDFHTKDEEFQSLTKRAERAWGA